MVTKKSKSKVSKKRKSRVSEFIKNPHKSLFILAGPLIVGFLVQTLYNVVDTAFVGRLGNEAIAALTFGFPIFFIFLAFSGGIAAGVNSRVSRFLGAKKKSAAENSVLHGLLLSCIFSVVIIVLGFFLLKPLFGLLGAEGITAVYAFDYMSIILFAILFMFPSFILNSVFAAQGDTKTATIVQVAGVLLNIVLDPIFIYVFGFGVKGAAIATTIAFAFSVILYVYFLHTRSYLEVRFRNFRFDPKLIKDIMFVGFPASLMMLLMSISLMFLNRVMSYFGMDYVAALGVSFRLDSIVMLPMIALSMAVLTLVGMFKGAGRIDLIRDIVKFAIKVCMLFVIPGMFLLFIFAQFALRIFTDDALLLSLGADYVRVTLFSLPFAIVSIMISRALQGMGYGFPGLVISVVRMILVALPLAYLFVFVLGYGYISVALSMVIGAAVSAVVALLMFRKYSCISS